MELNWGICSESRNMNNKLPYSTNYSSLSIKTFYNFEIRSVLRMSKRNLINTDTRESQHLGLEVYSWRNLSFSLFLDM